MNHVLPPQYPQTLKVLQDQAPSVDWVTVGKYRFILSVVCSNNLIVFKNEYSNTIWDTLQISISRKWTKSL